MKFYAAETLLMQIAAALQSFGKRWEMLRAFPARLLEAVMMCVITISDGDLVLLEKGLSAIKQASLVCQ